MEKSRWISAVYQPAFSLGDQFCESFCSQLTETGWVLLKQCNNGEEAVTGGFPWECIKPEEKAYMDIVLSFHKGGRMTIVKCGGTCPPSVISLFINGPLKRLDLRETLNFGSTGTFLESEYQSPAQWP